MSSRQKSTRYYDGWELKSWQTEETAPHFQGQVKWEPNEFFQQSKEPLQEFKVYLEEFVNSMEGHACPPSVSKELKKQIRGWDGTGKLVLDSLINTDARGQKDGEDFGRGIPYFRVIARQVRLKKVTVLQVV